MLGESKIIADVIKVTPTTFVLGKVNESYVAFSVEEEEMIVDLEFQGTLAQTVGEEVVNLTLFVDGVDQADLVDGIVAQAAPATAAKPFAVKFGVKKRFAQGEHKAYVAVKSAAGNVTVLGALRPAHFQVLRMPANAVVAANQNSRQAGGVY